MAVAEMTPHEVQRIAEIVVLRVVVYVVGIGVAVWLVLGLMYGF